MTDARSSSALHRVAILTAVATFPLIFMGGLVTSRQAGMSVPDWPNSYGYNMFLFPPTHWVGGILYEHRHRLMGAVVGFLSIVLVLFAFGAGTNAKTRRWISVALGVVAALAMITGAVAWFTAFETLVHRIAAHSFTIFGGIALILIAALFARTHEPREWVRWLTVVVLVSVIVQGILGGLRVVLVKIDFAIVHACMAQAFFCLTAFTAVVTSRWWIEHDQPQRDPDGRRLIWVGAIAVAVIYLQLIAGAVMRHDGAGLAIPDLPLAYGAIIPPTSETQLADVNRQRVFHMDLPAVTLKQVWVHFAHRVGAVLVSIAIVALAIEAWRRGRRELTRPAVILVALLLVQIVLGVLTVLMRKPAEIATAHLAVGALCLMITFVILVRAMRLYATATGFATDPQPRSVRLKPAGGVA